MLVLSFAAAVAVAATVAIASIAFARRGPTRWLLFMALFAAITGVGVAATLSGLRFNFTPSMPLGIYRFNPLPQDAIQRQMLVAVCAPSSMVKLGRRRGYLSGGPCLGATEPLLKTVAAVAGDNVAVSFRGVTVNGRLLHNSKPLAIDRAGRELSPSLPVQRRIPNGAIWVYADHPHSWDSRYWGPVGVRNVLARVVPVLVKTRR
ncbi:MAG: conjugative transfer signal peptidase TraF [Candidatus Eremiobacteraeota bacterium]|nr:conjugative transfer signal peptidase TraF [Candidatus Eremiobacteraeota bacterium]